MEKMKEYVADAKRNGIKTNELIERSKIARSSFFQIMKGNQTPSIIVAKKIADALGVTIDDLLNSNEVGEMDGENQEVKEDKKIEDGETSYK